MAKLRQYLLIELFNAAVIWQDFIEIVKKLLENLVFISLYRGGNKSEYLNLNVAVGF